MGEFGSMRSPCNINGLPDDSTLRWNSGSIVWYTYSTPIAAIASEDRSCCSLIVVEIARPPLRIDLHIAYQLLGLPTIDCVDVAVQNNKTIVNKLKQKLL